MMLKQRILTALGLMVILLAVILSGSLTAFVILLMISLGATTWEITRINEYRYPFAYAYGAAIILGITVSTAKKTLYVFLACFVVFAWFVYFIPSLFYKLPRDIGWATRFFERIYYACIFSSFMAAAFIYRQSWLLFLSLLILVSVADSGAYFAGKKFGKRKLAPDISPGKTWEGVAGGIIATLLVSVATVFIPVLDSSINVILYNALGWAGMVGGIILLVAVSVTGDLQESRFKRRRGIKDSSSILPGHGGILDRIDSLIPILPLAVLIHICLV